MTDPTKTPDPADKAPETGKAPEAGKKPMTAAQAAKLVKRPVLVKQDDGSFAEGTVPVTADEVIAFKDYGTHVVVVTKDGQKFTNAAA